MNLTQAYRTERAPHVGAGRVYVQPASHALREARIRLAWDAANGYVCEEFDAPETPDHGFRGQGLVRLMVRVDDDPSSALDGDFSERDLKELRERANRDGVCGVEAQFWTGAEWESVDSTWGFIGNDWERSGYDTDLMRAALDALAEHNAEQAAEIEAQRPDLYA